jgi:hypothetical protein
MQILRKARFSRPRSGHKMGLALRYADAGVTRDAEGTFIFDMRDASTGEQLHYFEKKNIITLDAGILAAILFKDNASRDRGIYMLAVGTGATGALLSPDAPSASQRKLNAEVARKAFVTTTFRDSGGNAVSIPTNVVDFTTTYAEAEAVGPLNEMGLISPISDNPLVTNPNPDTFPARLLTRDLTLYDILVNYLTFAVVSKPSTAILTITWRLTF